jgi:hypothetical protein
MLFSVKLNYANSVKMIVRARIGGVPAYIDWRLTAIPSTL